MVVLCAAVSAAGCANSGPLDVTYELTGPPGATIRATIQAADSAGGRRRVDLTQTSKEVRLPWSETVEQERGQTVLTAGASTGPLECRVVVAGREVDKQVGDAGEAVTCSGEVDN